MLAISGDTHNNLSNIEFKAQWFINEAKKRNHLLTKKDYLCILGDFGFTFSFINEKDLIKTFKTFEDLPFTTLFIDGNHEGFDVLNNLKEVNMFDGIVGKYTNSIYHLKRGEIYNISGHKIFTMGGALSIDKDKRTLGYDYFLEEIPSFKDEYNAFNNLEKNKYSVDYVFTHTAPAFVSSAILSSQHINYMYNDYTSKLLSELEKIINCKKWFFGHFHYDWEYLNKFQCVNEKVIILD